MIVATASLDVSLEISNLSVAFRVGRRTHEVVHGVSMHVSAGQRVGVIGESGSGKTVTALSVLGLHDRRRTRYSAQSAIRFGGRDLLSLSSRELREVRGAEIAMVFQDPVTSLNPVFTVGAQVMSVLRIHQALSRRQALAAAEEALRAVEIRDPATVLTAYPHQLSGGMRQRVLIAMALACQPRVLIADEPTSALDVTVQATVLDLLRSLVTRSGTSLLLITHDMGVVAQLCDFVYVMYEGRVVEHGSVRDLFTSPYHPYTRALLQSTPRVNGPRPRRLATIGAATGTSAGAAASGCPFAPRCAYVADRCLNELPVLGETTHAAACHRLEYVAELAWTNVGSQNPASGPAHTPDC